MVKLKIEYLPPDALKPYRQNARKQLESVSQRSGSKNIRKESTRNSS